MPETTKAAAPAKMTTATYEKLLNKYILYAMNLQGIIVACQAQIIALICGVIAVVEGL